MALHPERYGDGLLVTGGRNEVLISMTDGEKVTKCRLFSLAEARAIAEDILQCCEEAKEGAKEHGSETDNAISNKSANL